MPYQYSTAQNPYALSIAEIMARRGDPQAQAAQTSGQAWGRAISDVGQTLGAIPQQIAQQKKSAMEDEVNRLKLGEMKRDVASRSVLGQAVSSTPHVDEDGVSLYDIPTISKKLEDQGFGDHVADVATQLKGLNDAFRTERQAKIALVQRGAQSLMQANGDPELTLHFLDTLEKNGTFPKGDIDTYRQIIAKDPSKTMAILQQFAGPAKIVMGAPGSTPVNDLTGKPVGDALPKPPTTEDALIDSYIGSLKLPTGTTWDKLSAEQKAAFPSWQHAQTVEPPKAGTPEDFVSRARRIAIQQNGGQPLSDQQQAAIDGKALEDFRKVNTDPEMRDARLALQAATLAARDPNGQVNQEKLENSYRTALMRPLSSRSGGLGLEDQKVNQAIHLMALIDQSKDKSGNYNIPRVQLNELALGLARLVSPGGQVGEGMMNELNQHTAKGDLAGAITYLTGQPVTGNTQAIIKMFRDSIERQGRVSENNRQTYLDAIKAMAPTDLAEDRRTKVEGALNLNRLAGAAATQTTSVPANVATALKGAGAGKHTLSDGSVWMIDANGNIAPGGR